MPGVHPHSLQLQPFENNRDGRFYFGSPNHEDSISRLLDLFNDQNQGFGLLQGGPGLGKTLLRTLLHRRLDASRFLRVSIETSLLDFDGLLLECISQISGDRMHPSDLPDRYSRLGMFKTLLSERIVPAGRHLAVLVDEAQGLDRSVLEGLRNLSNISAERSNLMTIALIGGSALEQTIRSLPELSQRIGVRCQLAPLSAAQTRDYVDLRLRIAGSESRLELDDATWSRLHRASSGVPREINRIMKQALKQARDAHRPLDRLNLSDALATEAVAFSHVSDEFA